MGVPSSNGVACTLDARSDRPRNMKPRAVPITTNVELAFFAAGSLKAGTPLEMASTPVTAAPPDAKAWSTTNNVAP